ncbi:MULTISPECIES: alpha/beta fold hydrolase [unclassified Streptomyces]|uniref:alpha/beta fold hydrolase n=1 Tax=unclassified Streptomyces TaxID=2593676 RepID=UPI000DC76D6F|nr:MULTISPECIES: alpha/beta fold hydrolase [unclassified Streptomyces]AWZ10856.1 alpha/beta hydrolase [Streptomyces sp. ICC4]AWZ17679.1 alpha/beta hydrolase [Streptomyces sp. ICC1]
MILNHDVAGPQGGPAVVLLHSSVCDRRMWEPQWAPLAAAGFRVVRADFRTCGESPASEVPYSDHGDVRELLDHLGIRRSAFVGSSYGGRIALTLAALHPERVSALALLCPDRPGRPPSPEMREFGAAEDALLDAGDLVGAAELNARQWLGPEATDDARGLVRDMQLGNFRSEPAAAGDQELPEPAVDLSAVRAPVLAVGGAHDVPVFRRIAAELPGVVPGATHVELPWAGHLPSLERPAEVTRMLLDFLPRS